MNKTIDIFLFGINRDVLEVMRGYTANISREMLRYVDIRLYTPVYLLKNTKDKS